MRRHRAHAFVRLLTACGVFAGLAPYGPAVAAPRASGWVVSRTGPGTALLTGTMTAKAGGAGATVALFGVKGSGANKTHENAFTTTRVDWGTDGWVSVYGPGAATPDCPGATCADPTETPFTMKFSSNGHRIASTVYIAAWDAVTSVTVTAPGWRVRPWQPSMHVVRAAEGGGTGVRVVHTTAGTFALAEAAGGRYGSYAMAVLPCGMWGQGSGELSGGARRYGLVCGGSRSWHDSAPGAARWRLAGNVTGVDGIVNVLVVVDYPR
ncbi:MAG: hypothetical protein QOE45_770 [Frankiaceae bacterium]|jgi:hypothetical protein|nr:hypothetical protein [Frankiaceae bacterium]